MTGRNEKCPCGSGKKYKHCHLNTEKLTITDIAACVPFSHEHKEIIWNTFFAMHEDFQSHPNAGACHLISGIMYILLREQNIQADLCIGEVQNTMEGYCFDHSWIEIDSKPFDISIQLTWDERRNAPVFAGYDLNEGKPSKFNYRFKAAGLGSVAWRVNQIPFVTYIDGANDTVGWSAAIRIGKKLGLSLDRETLRQRYQETYRTFVSK